MYIEAIRKNGVPDFIKVNMLLCWIDTCLGDWSLNNKFFSRNFFNN